MSDSYLWDRRYKEEGSIWGDKPSETALLLLENIGKECNLVDFGYGYGRDLESLARLGHKVTGYEMSGEGFYQTSQRVGDLVANGDVALGLGHFYLAPLEMEYYDAVYSHRTLHLLDDNIIDSFILKSHEILKSNGIICISARNSRDFNSDQMNEIEPGVAEYKDINRRGHRIRFWDNDYFIEKFSQYFNILKFVERNEIEAVSNSKQQAHFTIMLARKKQA